MGSCFGFGLGFAFFGTVLFLALFGGRPAFFGCGLVTDISWMSSSLRSLDLDGEEGEVC